MRPLTPRDCDLREFPCMMLDVDRLRDSSLAFKSTGDEFKAAVMLWAASWHQKPAASLPSDDDELAGLGRVDRRRWAKLRARALHGWIECDDGRLYHPLIAEKALECWIDKLLGRISSGAGHAKRYGSTFDPAPLYADVAAAGELLRDLNPKSRQLSKVRRSAGEEGQSAPDGLPLAVPPAWQGKGTERTTLPERAQRPAPDPNKAAWDAAVLLLTPDGRVKVPGARAFFAKLLRDHSLEARDLHPAVISAGNAGTPDPQAYLTAAAKNVASRKQGGPVVALIDSWGPDQWDAAVRIFRENGRWGETWGPKPGEPGSRVPPAVLRATLAPVVSGGAA